MRKIIATLAAAALLAASQTGADASDRGKEVKPVFNVPAKARHADGGKVLAGFALGAIVAGAVLASRSQSGRADYSHGYRRAPDACGLWLADCRDGSDRACYRYETRC